MWLQWSDHHSFSWSITYRLYIVFYALDLPYATNLLAALYLTANALGKKKIFNGSISFLNLYRNIDTFFFT